MTITITTELSAASSKQITAQNTRLSSAVPDMFLTDKSKIKLSAAFWPQRLTTGLGNGEDFRLVSRQHDGSRRYEQDGGLILRVLLD